MRPRTRSVRPWNPPAVDDLNEDTGRPFDSAGVPRTTPEEHGIDPARARLVANAAQVDLDRDMAMRALEREGVDPEAAETALERFCAAIAATRILYDEQACAPRRRRDASRRLEGAFAVAVLTTVVATLPYFSGVLSGVDGVN